jgi:hypothetical protein
LIDFGDTPLAVIVIVVPPGVGVGLGEGDGEGEVGVELFESPPHAPVANARARIAAQPKVLNPI